MNTRFGLITAAWAVSCGAAFVIGRGTVDPASAASDTPGPGAPAERSVSRAGSLGSASSAEASRARSVTRRDDNSSFQSIDAVRDRAKELKALTDPIARAEAFLEFVRNLQPDEFLAAVDAYREGGIANEQFGEYRMLLTSWAQVNPTEALDYATEKTGTPFARQTILAAWAKNDTEGALAWARENFKGNKDDNGANPWIIGVIEGISDLDLGRATQLLEELPRSRGRGTALDTVFREVESAGTEAAKRWIANLTDESLKQGAAARLAGQLANDDPQAAAEWASTLGPDVMKRAAGEIIGEWAKQDLSAATSWVERQPEDVVASAGPSLVREMAQSGDFIAASEWLSNYEGNPAFDDSIRSLAYNAIEKEPALAADWIMRLSSERDQERTMHRLIGGWMRRDAAGAADYIANNPVPESIKRRMELTDQDR